MKINISNNVGIQMKPVDKIFSKNFREKKKSFSIRLMRSKSNCVKNGL